MREYGTERVTWVKVEVAGTNYCSADKIKDYMMGRSRKIYSEFWWVNVKKRDLLEDLILDRKILNPTKIFLGAVY
jgi:hypothetical protein